jgi:hypothetical protein
MVDISPERGALLQIDMSVLNGATLTQVLSATLWLYSLTAAKCGGSESVIPEGNLNEDAAAWETSPYTADRTGAPVGAFERIWVHRFY